MYPYREETIKQWISTAKEQISHFEKELDHATGDYRIQLLRVIRVLEESLKVYEDASQN